MLNNRCRFLPLFLRKYILTWQFELHVKIVSHQLSLIFSKEKSGSMRWINFQEISLGCQKTLSICNYSWIENFWRLEVNPFHAAMFPLLRSSRLFEEFSLRQQILQAVGGLLQCIYDHIRQLGKWSVRSMAVHLSLTLQHGSNNKSSKWPNFSIRMNQKMKEDFLKG